VTRTEITLSGGERVLVEQDASQVEAAILAASRGSIMELAWVVDAQTGDRVGINPEHVLTLRVKSDG
jgi:hypothetical protein